MSASNWIAGCYRALQAAVGRQLRNRYEVPKELPHQLLATLVQLTDSPGWGRANKKSTGETRWPARRHSQTPKIEVVCPVCGRSMTYLHTIRRAFADDLVAFKCNPCGFSMTERASDTPPAQRTAARR
jgi:hypothetical protein